MQPAYARMVYERHLRVAQKRGNTEGRRAGANFKAFLKDACRKIIAFLFTQVGVCCLVVAYNILGAFAFRAIEGEMGDPTPEESAKELREQMVSRLWNVTLRLNILEETQWRQEVVGALEEYQETVVPLVKTRGYRGVYPKDTWSFSASLMYSLSVYTTIGYGNLAPRTEWGKITTILYAIIGMPLMLLYMSNVGEILANIFKFLYFRACRCDIGSLGYYRSASGTIKPVTATQGWRPNGLQAAGGGRGRGNKQQVGSEADPSSASPPSSSAVARAPPPLPLRRRTIPITWCLLVIAIYVGCGGLIFSQWERWSILDACYFSYISLSTIGFGDLVPGKTVAGDNDDQEVESQQIICTVYLLVGSALVAMCFNLMQEETIENLKTFWRNIGCLRKKNKKMTVKKETPKTSRVEDAQLEGDG